MQHQTTLTYTESLIRKAVFAYWCRSLGVGFALAMLATALALGYLVYVGDRSWFVDVIATVLALGVVTAAMLYAVHLRNGFARLRSLGAEPATLATNDDGLTVSSTAGTSTIPWSSVTQIWQYPTFWLLFLSKSHYMTLPLASVSTEMRTQMLERLASKGVSAAR